MRRPTLYVNLLLGLLVSFWAGCSKSPDKIVNIADNDPEMLAAIAKARETLPQFWQHFERPAQGESDFSLKVSITDPHGTEHFWLRDLERKDGKIWGTIDNDPQTVTSVRRGERRVIPEADISDWTYLRGGKMVGNYTLRVLFKHMSPEEVEMYKKMLAEP